MGPESPEHHGLDPEMSEEEAVSSVRAAAPPDKSSAPPSPRPVHPKKKYWADYDEEDDRRVYEEDVASLFSDVAPPADRYPVDQLPTLFVAAADRMDITLPPQPVAPPVDFTDGARVPSTSPSSAQAYRPYCYVQDWCNESGVPHIEDGVRLSLLPSSSLWPGGKPQLPSEKDRLTAALFDRCYANATQVVALASNLAFLAGSMSKLLEGNSEPSALDLGELRTTMATFLRMSQALAIDGGRSMCAAQVGCRHLWLGLSSLKDQEKKQLLNLPLSTASLFWFAHLAPHLRPQSLSALLPSRQKREAASPRHAQRLRRVCSPAQRLRVQKGRDNSARRTGRFFRSSRGGEGFLL
ncbi:hypothetical protein WMY93_030687 [Mugilogobius chulae]|uniref:Uncharacterized protein n=1 Tax=Mugilogobius chulae TaxID=88201 RepID=A0AAW0MGZ7_9GOBI